jgi:hypothetical protein
MGDERKVKDAEDLLTPSPTPQEAEEGKTLEDKQKEGEGQGEVPLNQKHQDTTGTA